MTRFLKLVHYEFARIRHLYLSLIAIVVVVQFGGLIWYTKEKVAYMRELFMRNPNVTDDFIGRYSFLNFVDQTIFFPGPIALCIVTLLLYVFLIWYRDWFGKNMFIYRLLMLPHSRMYVFTAKLLVIWLSVLGLVAIQLLILPLQIGIFDRMMPDAYQQMITLNEMIRTHLIFSILVPTTFTKFVLSYATGAIYVIVVFTAILLERSFRWKGIVAGILYSALACVVFLLPIIIAESMDERYFYPLELFWMTVGTGVLVTGASLWLSHYLLKKKVSV